MMITRVISDEHRSVETGALAIALSLSLSALCSLSLSLLLSLALLVIKYEKYDALDPPYYLVVLVNTHASLLFFAPFKQAAVVQRQWQPAS